MQCKHMYLNLIKQLSLSTMSDKIVHASNKCKATWKLIKGETGLNNVESGSSISPDENIL